MEVFGDLHAPRPPFNPVHLLRLQHLLQQILSSSSSRSTRAAQESLTRWLCGRSEDPGALKRGAPRLLAQCNNLLQQHVHPVALLLYRRRLLGGGPFEGGPPSDYASGGPPEVGGVMGAPAMRAEPQEGAPSQWKKGAPSQGAPFQGDDDGQRLALCIEGGAMRGCVCAGMAVALHHMGFMDSFDVVYGSSAGALIGAFAVSRQLAYEGTSVYTDWLPYLGKEFIDAKRIGRALGLGCLMDLDVKDFISSRLGRPLVNLDALLVGLIQNKQQINWEQFEANDQKQPLKACLNPKP